MNIYNFSYNFAINQPPNLAIIQQEIEAAIHPLVVDGIISMTQLDTIMVTTDDTLDATQLALAQGVIDAHDPNPLSYHKQVTFSKIDQVTAMRIFAGFTYNGLVFSLSPLAQSKWLALDAKKEEFTYPFDTPSIDNLQYQTISNSTDVSNMSAVAMQTVASHLAAGTDAKKQVVGAVDHDSVDVILETYLTI